MERVVFLKGEKKLPVVGRGVGLGVGGGLVVLFWGCHEVVVHLHVCPFPYRGVRPPHTSVTVGYTRQRFPRTPRARHQADPFRRTKIDQSPKPHATSERAAPPRRLPGPAHGPA